MVGYEFENVEVKEDFEIYEYDDDGEIIDTLVIKKGTKGVVESMGLYLPRDPEPYYDLMFYLEDGNEVDVCLYESEMEQFIALN
ncbi:hypothetical protein [Aneurinibacillus migulanus]|uniref:DUF1292 domain-containing protein n=1 Tax=Aneurinibacillus migulanus TaxID=47500 RepID=A0A0D1YNU3_ANEMI|nr:hypothetical protein [Aneurinibacillus migulanus]KIV60307.1 hypothetical protein TS65_00550 [Aneurinibacillus migulanus]KON90495.1 hypothetical protein AF333_28860 [Aneurinibacillus migulanus]MED0894929.1 hypothetical protein [Aneurinibacillus migulanus]MED1614428.1 hypothetical protein [Aneurinibacillus migulanus]SDJ77968.1 hypothetical protein SAMN04487909_12859 [Aneurinibacillus migulanus]